RYRYTPATTSVSSTAASANQRRRREIADITLSVHLGQEPDYGRANFRLYRLKALIQIDGLDEVFELLFGLLMLLLEVVDFFVQRVQPIFLLVELTRVALQKSFLLSAPLERLHVLAQPSLIFADGIDLLLAGSDLAIQIVSLALLVQHRTQGLHGSG